MHHTYDGPLFTCFADCKLSACSCMDSCWSLVASRHIICTFSSFCNMAVLPLSTCFNPYQIAVKLMWAVRLCRTGDRVKVFALHPGTIWTNLFRYFISEGSFVERSGRWFASFFLKTVPQVSAYVSTHSTMMPTAQLHHRKNSFFACKIGACDRAQIFAEASEGGL